MLCGLLVMVLRPKGLILLVSHMVVVVQNFVFFLVKVGGLY